MEGSISELASELAAMREQEQAKCTEERIEILEGNLKGLVTVGQLKQVEARMQGALEVGLREHGCELRVPVDARMRNVDADEKCREKGPCAHGLEIQERQSGLN